MPFLFYNRTDILGVLFEIYRIAHKPVSTLNAYDWAITPRKCVAPLDMLVFIDADTHDKFILVAALPV